ncbi:tetratricopeptide repeat protein [Pseudochryseolinea flava]|uniref:histidine kinase n=1 Tax=Pseudochryseolinea flava TaxID=2059302 RepID=A0A364Y7H9_9BACT|nr:tetratricopeptide repeat protein [Pseudochryseolinea flava]RAW02853.1 hypothetical protein DQQ10_01725 [Pseudochryseolinea flava]
MKSAIFIFIFFSFLVNGSRVLGQTYEVKRKLKDSLTKARTSEERVDALNNLAWEYFDFDDSLAVNYAKEAFQIAEKSDYRRGLKYAYTLLAIGEDAFGNYQQALRYFRLSNEIPSEESIDNTVYNLTQWGNVLSNVGQYDSAALAFDNAIGIAATNNLTTRLSNIYCAYARLSTQRWQNQKALEYLSRVKQIKQDSTAYSRTDFYATCTKVYINILDFENAMLYANKLCAITAKIDDNYHKGMCFLFEADLDYAKGHYEDALNHCFRALWSSRIFNYHLQRAQLYFRIGKIYRKLSDYDLAQSFYFKALAITETSGLQPLNAELYNEIGWNYKDLGNLALATQYVDRAQMIFNSIQDQKGIADSHGTRGAVLFSEKKYKESIEEHRKALVLRKQINFTEGVAASVFNLALNYEALGDLTKALQLQHESLQLKQNVIDKNSVANSYFGIAHVLMQQNRLNEAQAYLEKAVSLSQITNSKLIRRKGYQYFAELFERKHDFQEAVAFRKKYESINDSIFSENISRKVADMQGLYQVERKEKEIELLNSQKALDESRILSQDARIRNQTIIIFIGSLLLVLVVFVSAYVIKLNRRLVLARQEQGQLNDQLNTHTIELRETNESLSTLNKKLSEKQEEILVQTEALSKSNEALVLLNADIQQKQVEISSQAAELKDANDFITQMNKTLEEKVAERTSQLRQAYLELDTFFYRSSHDFRRPLTTFMGLAEVAKITVKDDNAIELFEKVKETAQGLDKMLKKLQSISDLGSQDLIYKEVVIREVISKIMVEFQEEVDRKKIKLTLEETSHHTQFYSYPALVRVIIENLIENAIHFSTTEAPYIKITTRVENDFIVIKVEDNGQGIAEEFQPRVFDMYFRANASSKGNGLGLYIASKATSRLNGYITLHSIVNVATTFTVRLPLTNKNLNQVSGV